jgi:glycosyltransferase involved in cell wall biosynthesis
MSLAEQYRIAAIVPCHNEEVAVAKVVADLHASVPGMTVYVYDNCSTDRTIERAQQAGAVVRSEPLKGKGNVVRRAFADIDADIYLLIDGDDTYDAGAAPIMIQKLVDQHLDHVLGVRREVERTAGSSAYRPAHETGNRALNKIVCAIFGDTLGDMLSGYRVFSRRFVKSFPAVSKEFEIETELTVHSLALRIPSTSVQVGFRDRAAGSESKLRTYRDGWKILHVIINLFRHERPITFFGLFAALTGLIAVALGTPVLVQYLQTDMVPRFPTLFVSSFLLMVSVLAMVAGLVLDGIRKARHEHSRLAYMRHPAVAITDSLSEAQTRTSATRSTVILPRAELRAS